MSSIQVNANAVLRGLDQTSRGMSNLRPMLEKFGEEFYRQETNWFATHSFAPLNPAYAKKKQERFGNKPILRASDAMFESFTKRGVSGNIHRIDALEAEFGSEDYKAIFHLRGTSRMPARPPLAEPNERRYSVIAEEYAAELIKSAGLN